MNAKVFKTLIVLVVLATALLMGNILLTGGEDTQATQVDTDSQTLQDKTCPAECEKACCEAKKEAKTCPAMKDPKACPTKCPKICCPKMEDTEACPAERQKSCSAVK